MGKKDLSINREYLRNVNSKRLAGLEYLAKKLGKNVHNLKRSDFEKGIGAEYCWAYSYPKKKRMTYAEALEVSKDKPNVRPFPCPECLHWHLGTVPPTLRAEGEYFVVELQKNDQIIFGKSPREMKEASPARKKKLLDRKRKYV